MSSINREKTFFYNVWMLKKARNILLEKKMKKAKATTRKGKRSYIIEIPTLFLPFTNFFFGTIDVFAAKPQIKKKSRIDWLWSSIEKYSNVHAMLIYGF